jgi:translation initiation factor 1
VSETRLVYSTDGGDRRREARKPRDAPGEPQLPDDGVVRVFREKGGRGGKTVTVVRGLPRGDLAAVASDLKRRCGSGGAVKDGAVEIQGDHREKVAARLESQGYRVKLAGG